MAVVYIDKAENGIQTLNHMTKSLSHVDVKSSVGSFVTESLDEAILKLENVIEFLSPGVTVAPEIKSAERFTQTKKGGPGPPGDKATFIVPKTVKVIKKNAKKNTIIRLNIKF